MTRRYAAERCIEIVSEASRRIPADWKAEHPSIPWSDIAGIGSVLRHDYEDVNLDIIANFAVLRSKPSRARRWPCSINTTPKDDTFAGDEPRQ